MGCGWEVWMGGEGGVGEGLEFRWAMFLYLYKFSPSVVQQYSVLTITPYKRTNITDP